MEREADSRMIWLPMFISGLGTCVLGLMWVLAADPWLLDQQANEILLKTSYEALFEADANAHLPDYLTGLYRFFGWWVFSIGLLISGYTHVTRLRTSTEQFPFFAIMGIILVGLYHFQIEFIPSSPYLWTSHGLTMALGLSLLGAARQHLSNRSRP